MGGGAEGASSQSCYLLSNGTDFRRQGSLSQGNAQIISTGIALNQGLSQGPRVCSPMAPFLYQCPATGQNVQGWFAEDVSTAEGESYWPFECLACRRVHLVNPATGRVLGMDE